MLDKRGGPIGGQPNWSSGFIPASYQGTLFRPAGTPILDLSPPADITRQAQRDQLDMLAELNRNHLASRPGATELAARAASYELAFRMQAEAPEAVDLSQESASTLELYGTENPQTAEFGRNCLIARRLVERGVRSCSCIPAVGIWKKHGTRTRAWKRITAAMRAKPMAPSLPY